MTSGREVAEDIEFRAAARAWLTENAPEHESPRSYVQAPTTFDGYHRMQTEAVARARRWQRARSDAGFAGISYPAELGGRGGTLQQEVIFNEESSRYRVGPGPLLMAVSMVAPTLIQHGSADQKQAHVPAILRGDEIWAQLYSEPDAGSDLASLRTKAERTGNAWLVNGQKVWTSGAGHADWAILLARTDSHAPKHHGISYFLLNMRTPGVEMRPLRQMSGNYHFYEVFLTDVRLTSDAVVGKVNDGWRVAHSTMANERAMIGSALASNVDDLVDLVRKNHRSDDPLIRQELMQIVIMDRVIGFQRRRAESIVKAGGHVGPEMAVGKLMFSHLANRAAALALSVQGADGMLAGTAAAEGGYWHDAFLNAPGLRIGGGTDEVQRNALAERVCGLPKDPRV